MRHRSCYITITVIFRQEKDRRWTAECVELGTGAFGASIEEARKDIKEAIELHLNSLERNGQIDRFFKENNIALIKEKPRRNLNVNVNIPANPNIFAQSYVHSVHSLAGAC